MVEYAPFAGNAACFEKYRDYIMVINGIDAQTNSHSADVTNTWSGRLSEGYPTVTALAASIYGPELPMGFVSGGGYRLERLAALMASDDLIPRQRHGMETYYQAQVALLGFEAGVGAAADLRVGGFDTHANHNAGHEPMLQHLTESIDYLWNTAEQLGIADRHIYPGDVQRARCVLAGIDQHENSLLFPLNTGGYMDFFA